MLNSTSKLSGAPLTEFLTPERIRSARRRRGITKTELAKRLGVTSRTVTKYESEGAPVDRASKLEEVLCFPAEFFSADPLDVPSADEVNFRAGRRANARERNSAVEISSYGGLLINWVKERFSLPSSNIPQLQDEDPKIAARMLREEWGLGTKPLPNLVQLCESKGIRVLGLPVLAESVDAYSHWLNNEPFVYIARSKTPERTRFDVAHELGHLVLHNSSDCLGEDIERQANDFASEFLIPKDSIIEFLPRNPSVDDIIRLKKYFKVSAMALAYAINQSGRMSEWAYRQTCVELTRRGYRSSEPEGMESHEQSRVFRFVLDPQRRPRITVREIARTLFLPEDDVHALTFGVELRLVGEREVNIQNGALGQHKINEPAGLRLVGQ